MKSLRVLFNYTLSVPQKSTESDIKLNQLFITFHVFVAPSWLLDACSK